MFPKLLNVSCKLDIEVLSSAAETFPFKSCSRKCAHNKYLSGLRSSVHPSKTSIGIYVYYNCFLHPSNVVLPTFMCVYRYVCVTMLQNTFHLLHYIVIWWKWRLSISYFGINCIWHIFSIHVMYLLQLLQSYT